jgi:hypothetical protein
MQRTELHLKEGAWYWVRIRESDEAWWPMRHHAGRFLDFSNCHRLQDVAAVGRRLPKFKPKLELAPRRPEKEILYANPAPPPPRRKYTRRKQPTPAPEPAAPQPLKRPVKAKRKYTRRKARVIELAFDPLRNGRPVKARRGRPRKLFGKKVTA